MVPSVSLFRRGFPKTSQQIGRNERPRERNLNRLRPHAFVDYLMANSCLIPNLSTRLRSVARVIPRILAACT